MRPDIAPTVPSHAQICVSTCTQRRRLTGGAADLHYIAIHSSFWRAPSVRRAYRPGCLGLRRGRTVLRGGWRIKRHGQLV